jgi:hypothetical protein
VLEIVKMGKGKRTEISILDVSARLLLRLDDIVACLGHILDEHFLQWVRMYVDEEGRDSTVARVMTKAALLAHTLMS